MPQKIRILIADDHPIFRDGVRQLLELEGFNVIGEATTGEEVPNLVSDLRPDVLLLDMMMPGITGLEVLRRLSKQRASSHTIVVTAFIEKSEIIEALLLGAEGIVPKHSSSEILFQSIRAVMAGEVWVSPDITVALVERLRAPKPSDAAPDTMGLTRRELEITAAVAEGQDNKNVARSFDISQYTVKHHLTRIFEKLCVSNRVELAMFARRHGLIELVERLRADESSSQRAARPYSLKAG
jgi:two-component system, NarL family, nitrate/nitrite response regulator NarL